MGFDELCGKRGGLCAIALLDGEPTEEKQARLEEHKETLAALRKRKAGGPFFFSWLDLGCHPEWASAFEIPVEHTPTLLVLSPSKLKYAQLVGQYDVSTMATFVEGVKSNRIGTRDISAVPSFASEECKTVQRGEVFEEETSLDDDFMAEILAEEKAKQQAMEEAEKAAQAEIGGAGLEGLDDCPTCEICEQNDLMCEARN